MKKRVWPAIKRKDPLLEKFHFFFIWIVRIILIIGFAREFLHPSLETIAVILAALFLTFLPAIVEKRYKIDLPIEFEIGFVILVFGSIVLGEINSYYFKFWWWDLMLHALTGIMVALVGFMFLFVLYKRNRVHGVPLMIAVFCFSLAAAVGGVWEIFEFAMDQSFGLNMQKSGLMDTMFDIIVNNAGALLVSVIGYIYLKSGEAPILSRIINRFKKENPRIAKNLPKRV